MLGQLFDLLRRGAEAIRELGASTPRPAPQPAYVRARVRAQSYPRRYR
jgi:hypothetical protein